MEKGVRDSVKTINNKLRSKNGASLMLALLFLLFCILVGGTILAAASANGFRVSRVSDKQKELQNSSVVRLVNDQLDGGFSLEIDPSTSKATLNGDYSAMRRLVAEMALWKYMSDNSLTDITLVCKGTSYSKSSFWYQQGSSNEYVCTMKLSGTNLVNQEVTVSMSGYNISVDLGEGSAVSVQLKCTAPPKEGNPSITWGEPQIKKEG